MATVFVHGHATGEGMVALALARMLYTGIFLGSDKEQDGIVVKNNFTITYNKRRGTLAYPYRL
jgi:hypothetical protein